MNPIISQAAIERLALYLRFLRAAQEDGIQIISSEDMGKRLGLTSVQIRKDLALFGQFGMKGIGYYTTELVNKIENILGLNNHWHMAIIGVGHLGGALANYKNFTANGFKLMALFDRDFRIIGSTINGVKISDIKNLKSIVANREIHIGVITVPAMEAQSVANQLVEAGIKGIWNFARKRIDVPDNVAVETVDLPASLAILTYKLAEKENSNYE